MKKSDAIRHLEALEITYLDDASTVEATKRMGREDNLAGYLSRRNMIITTPLDAKKLEALQASGWDIMMRCAHVRDFDPEIDDEPTASLESVRAPRHGLVVVKVGQGCLGHDSSTIVDIKKTADNYRQLLHEPLMAGDGECHARPALLGALRSHVEASCPEHSREQAEEQIRLLAHAVFVNLKTSYPFHGYETGEAYR